MPHTEMTETEVEQEIQRLKQSPHVKLAQMEQRLKMRRRKQLYQLRWLEKRGKALEIIGLNAETLREYIDNQ